MSVSRYALECTSLHKECVPQFGCELFWLSDARKIPNFKPDKLKFLTRREKAGTSPHEGCSSLLRNLVNSCLITLWDGLLFIL